MLSQAQPTIEGSPPPPTPPFQPSPPKNRILPNSPVGCGAVRACMVSRPAKLCAHTFNASLHCLPRPLPRLSPLPQSLPIRTIPRPALILGFLAKGELLLLSQAQPTIEGSPPPPTPPFQPSPPKNRILPNSPVGCGAVRACMVSRPAKLCAHTFNASLHCLPRPLPRLSPPVQ